MRRTNRRRIIKDVGLKIAGHGFHASQIAMAMMANRMTHQTTGVTFFELPLRGESLAAWLNSVFIRRGRRFSGKARASCPKARGLRARCHASMARAAPR